LGMSLRLIAAAGLVAIASQGCYGPMYNPPYSSQGYPVGPYPGPIQTTVPGGQYAPGSMPGGTSMPQGSPVPTYGAPSGFNNAPTYSPSTGPSAARPVPDYQMPDTRGAREMGFTAGGNGLIQTAGGAPMPAEPNPFSSGSAAPLQQPAPVDPGSAPTTISADNFQGGNSGPTTYN
jgi:hypothetical protein